MLYEKRDLEKIRHYMSFKKAKSLTKMGMMMVF